MGHNIHDLEYAMHNVNTTSQKNRLRTGCKTKKKSFSTYFFMLYINADKREVISLFDQSLPGSGNPVAYRF